MSTQISRWLLVAIVLVSGVRCSTPEKSTLCFVSTLTETEGSQTRVFTFVYEFSRLKSITLSEGGTTTVTTYLYDDKGNVGGSTKVSGSAVVEEGSYSYDKQNKLQAATLIGTDYETTIQYSYNDNGQLVSEVETTLSGAGDVLISRAYTYPDILTKNPSMITTTVSGNAPDQLELEYDNKIAPLRNLFPTTKAANNVVKETYLNGTTLVETTYSITYQYNAEGYPVSAVSTSGKTQTWVYDCREI
ncbi:MAG: hypothetical protein JNN04_13790 [Cyclobacteriaceae bacterium]|nr:hypothetical protein [Cyclobacteriaceae bacterium]